MARGFSTEEARLRYQDLQGKNRYLGLNFPESVQILDTSKKWEEGDSWREGRGKRKLSQNKSMGKITRKAFPIEKEWV